MKAFGDYVRQKRLQLQENDPTFSLRKVAAAIDVDNHASLRLHEELGFEPVGRMPEVARKFDRWVDLALLQIIL